jgi:hypothetical protein
VKKLVVIMTLIGILLLSSCAGNTPIPSGTLPTSAAQAPDDIISSPGGAIYRANVTQEGETNPWPRIPTGIRGWSVGWDTISVYYRPEIASKPGESHTNIIVVTHNTNLDTTKNKLELYAVKVPKGITLTDTHNTAVTIPGTVGTVLVVTTSPGLAVGNYSFKITLAVSLFPKGGFLLA